MAGFQKATKKQAKARIALDGPSGSGKTWTSLVTATALAAGGSIAVIDSERGSASKYADKFDFDVLEIDGNFHPDHYIAGIRAAAQGGYAVVVIDSLTHAWAGTGGVLEVVDAAKSRFGGNSYMAWSVGTPLWQSLIDAMLSATLHVVVTLRSKSKFVEVDKGNGKKGYERTGTEPVARDGVEYEFDVVGDLDLEHTMVISKSRADERVKDVYRRPGPEFGEGVLEWLTDGAVNTDALARELLAVVGPEGKEELGKQMKAAKLTVADLADEKKLAKARSIAEGIAALAVDPPADAPSPDEPDDGAPADEATVISEQQRKRMLAIGSKAGLDHKDVKEVVAGIAEVDSTTKVPIDKYDEVIAYLEGLVEQQPAVTGAAS